MVCFHIEVGGPFPWGGGEGSLPRKLCLEPERQGCLKKIYFLQYFSPFPPVTLGSLDVQSVKLIDRKSISNLDCANFICIMLDETVRPMWFTFLIHRGQNGLENL